MSGGGQMGGITPEMALAMMQGQMPMATNNAFPSLPGGQMPQQAPSIPGFPQLPVQQGAWAQPQPYQQPHQGAFNPFAMAFASQGAPNPFMTAQSAPTMPPTLPGPQAPYSQQAIADTIARLNAQTAPTTNAPTYQVPSPVTQVLQNLSTAGKPPVISQPMTPTQALDPSIVFEPRESVGNSMERDRNEGPSSSGGQG